MNIKCCICHELFVPSDDVYFTPCGHFFHFPCVSHWLERSKTCPQCRTKVTERSIHRAYFNFATTDDTEVDTTVLTSRIDTLNFQILLKDKDLKICGEDNAILKKQTAGLRAEVRKLEVEIEKHRSAIYAFKEQVKYMKQQTLDTDAAKREVVRLTKKLQEYQNIESIISDSQDKIDRMLCETQDKTALVTYVSVLKREMEASVHRRKELREKINRLERENIKIKTVRDEQEVKCRHLEENLAHCENEKKSLWKKLQELESQLGSERKTCNEDVHRFIAESPAPERLKTLRETQEIHDISDCNVGSPDMFPELKHKAKSPEASPEEKSATRSSYLPVKSQGACGYSTLNKQSSRLRPSSSSLSILTKKPRLTAPSKTGEESKEMHYDGYGGHSKVDDYPSPILRFKPKVLKNNLISVKTKRRKLPDGSNKKLDQFFVDLT